MSVFQVYVFAEADAFTKLLEPFQDAARKFKSKVDHLESLLHSTNLKRHIITTFLDYILSMQIMFVLVDIKEDNLAKPFLTLFGLEDSEDTLVSFVSPQLT